jgi:hypothetical protein
MNKATRFLALTGMAVAAGLTMAAGPASAASAAPAAGSTAAKAPSNDRIVGYYRNPFLCHRAGNIGESRNKWDDHECSRVRGGFRRGLWALQVSWDHHGGPFGHDNHGGPFGHDNHGDHNDHNDHNDHGHNDHGPRR